MSKIKFWINILFQIKAQKKINTIGFTPNIIILFWITTEW